MNYLGTSPQDFNSFKDFAKKFPSYASSAYNMMSYGYMRGDCEKKGSNYCYEVCKNVSIDS